MLGQLVDKDLAALHAKFVLPLIMDDILNDLEPFDDIAEQAINDMLDEYRPDTALICIALCAQRLAAHVDHTTVSQPLMIEANKLVADYGSVWLAYDYAHEQGMVKQIETSAIEDVLVHVPEDLETLGCLLDDVMDALGEEHYMAAILIDILAQQAFIHQENAETELALLRQERSTDLAQQASGAAPARTTAPHQAIMTASYEQCGSNIIAFPSHS